MNKLQAMEVFVRVVDLGGFTRASESLGMPKATVTTSIRDLEQLLNVKLLNRTTRKVAVTTDGAAYYERCVAILDQVRDAEESLSNDHASVSGRLRVDVATVFARVNLLPVIGEFLVKTFNKRYAVDVRAKGTIKLCFAKPDRFPAARLAEAVAEAAYRIDLPWAESALLRSMRGLALSQFLRGRTAWKSMAAVTAPTLVLWGDTDRLVAPDLAPYVAAAIPDSRLLVLEDVGHTAMMEDPVTSARAVVALLDSVRDTAEGSAA